MSCIIHDFRVTARNAMETGFDGVEIHSANGYLIENELYGGSLENHCRLALEVVEAVANEIGADKVGIKLSPFYDSNGTEVSSPESVGVYMVNELNKLGILYVHMVEKRFVKSTDNAVFNRSLGVIRKAFKGTFMVSGGYGKYDGHKAVADNYEDLVSFGRLFLANQDLPKRFELDASLNKHERSTFYTPDPLIGYTDYPFLQVAS